MNAIIFWHEGKLFAIDADKQAINWRAGDSTSEIVATCDHAEPITASTDSHDITNLLGSFDDVSHDKDTVFVSGFVPFE